jgi:uncharacterized membrane protein YfcA
MSWELWLLTGLAGFAAGLLDSIVGGGGLILTPAMLNLHPGLNILQTIATQRTSSLLGTSVAAVNYFRHVTVERRIVLPALAAALASAAVGVQFAKRIDPDVLKGVVLGAACGFYNGLIGPGTGVLLVFAFVSVIGLDFLKSSAVSKTTNVAADLSSWSVLAFAGFVQWTLAIPLIIGNMLGSYVGSRLAIRRGDRFIRMVFLGVVLALAARVGWGLLP